MKELLYGAAYYDEYMPYERLAKDVSMMQKAGINTVRIAESTWSTCEPQEGVFDFSHVIRMRNPCPDSSGFISHFDISFNNRLGQYKLRR